MLGQKQLEGGEAESGEEDDFSSSRQQCYTLEHELPHSVGIFEYLLHTRYSGYNKELRQ